MISDKINMVVYETIKRKVNAGEKFITSIEGISMLPRLQKGDRVLVDPNPEKYCVGDMVLIDWGKTYVVHRLVSLENMQTKGDNLDNLDPPNLKIVGKCKQIELRDTGERKMFE